MATGNTLREQAIRRARDVGLRKLLEAQYPNGAWPQRYDGVPKQPQDFPVLPAHYPKTWSRVYPKANYINHYTFNDNSHRDWVLLALKHIGYCQTGISAGGTARWRIHFARANARAAAGVGPAIQRPHGASMGAQV